MTTNNDRRHHDVSINGKEYSRVTFLTGETRYMVRCTNGTLRSLTTSSVIARIDAACMESDHLDALAIDAESNRRRALSAARTVQNEFSILNPLAMQIAIEDAHAEALKMDARYDAETAQWVFTFGDKSGQEMVVDFAHSEALRMNELFSTPAVEIVIGDSFSVSTGSVLEAINAFKAWRTSEANAGRGGSIYWPCNCFAIVHGMKLGISPNGRLWRDIGVEFTDYEGWQPHSLPTLAERAAQVEGNGQLKRTPVQIIADYLVRFLNNNRGAMLSEAKTRLEKKIVQFVSDGCNEAEIRQAFSAALGCRSGAAFREACETKL